MVAATAREAAGFLRAATATRTWPQERTAITSEVSIRLNATVIRDPMVSEIARPRFVATATKTWKPEKIATL
jgi:hypothetical protein